MENRPAVSVITPTWNGERYVRQTLESVFSQTFRDFEVIVVDDGSTDGTRSAIEPFFSRLRYIRQERQGQSVARNRGAKEARGRYLALLDHDDCWEPAYLERMTSYLEAHPDVGLVMPQVCVIDADGHRTPHIIRKKSAGRSYTTQSLLRGDVGSIRNPVIRRSAFEASGGYDPSICGPEDCDLWIRLSFLTELHVWSEPLLLYRTHPGNYHKNRLENAREWLRVLDKLVHEHPEFARDNAGLVRRNRGKQELRLGRELLAASADDPRLRPEARRALGRSLRHRPVKLKAWLYAALTVVPGTGPLYAAVRRRQLDARERLAHSKTRAWLRGLGH